MFRAYVTRPETLRGMVLDSNAAAQEKGVEAVKAVSYTHLRAHET